MLYSLPENIFYKQYSCLIMSIPLFQAVYTITALIKLITSWPEPPSSLNVIMTLSVPKSVWRCPLSISFSTGLHGGYENPDRTEGSPTGSKSRTPSVKSCLKYEILCCYRDSDSILVLVP